MEQVVQQLLKANNELENVIELFHKAGGVCYLVGGYVRDYYLDRPSTDIDIEIHLLDFNQIEKIIGDQYKIHRKGSFGTFIIENIDVEFSLPRTENSVGIKHTDFEITVVPELGEYEAAKRRDFTINSLMFNLQTMELVDNFKAMAAIEAKEIIHISDSFSEDPLRVLRAIRFSSQLGFTINNQTMDLCLQLIDDVKALSVSRKEVEFNKWFYGDYFQFSIDHVENFILMYFDMKDLRTTAQNPQYHPEGDVWEHTKQVLKICANHRSDFEPKQFTILMKALLFHDLGKITKTYVDDEGRIRSSGHEHESFLMSKGHIKEIESKKKHIKLILNLIDDHMLPIYINEMKPSTLLRTYNKYQEHWKLLVDVSIFDKSGRSAIGSIDEMEAKYKVLKARLYRDWELRIKILEQAINDNGGSKFVALGYQGPEIKKRQYQAIIKQVKYELKQIKQSKERNEHF